VCLLSQVLSNGVLLVDKPVRWSSADVVRQLRSALKVDRVCFGAPLDTQATGLLIILLGEGTSAGSVQGLPVCVYFSNVCAL